MSEIEILQTIWNEASVKFLFGMMIGSIAIIIGVIFTIYDKKFLLLIPLGIIFLAIGIPAYYEMTDTGEELRKLIKERDDALDQKLKTMSCNDMRLDILDILENEKEKYIEDKLEWEQEYYYHKCEIPLREEILKLQ